MTPMTPDQFLMCVELILLGVIVWQGELIRRYEKWTYEMNRERWDERAKWREAKRQQQLKKDSTIPTSESNANSASPSPTESSEPKTKKASAKSAGVPLTPTDLPT